MPGKARLRRSTPHITASAQGLPGVDRERVIVVVVDADGRIAPTAPHFVAAHFEDPQVGGVQALVRIYNRTGFLTQMQDVEFSVYGSVYQAGRNHAGTAGMGGNGQFNRLSALDAIADGDGPWRNRLTEDQDLGLRLLAAGWKIAPGDARGGRAAGRSSPAATLAATHPLGPGQSPGVRPVRRHVALAIPALGAGR